jgi:phage I-like protein
MSDTLFYTLDLEKAGVFELSEGTRSCIQIFPLGDYSHPVYGQIKITTDRVKNFVRNFVNRVRGTDLDVDYEHKEFTSAAAGWIVELEDRGDQGLWAQVDWTPTAAQSLRDREYRYFSPEFADTWVNPKTGAKYTDVLFGGAITNRPFLKDIVPINMSEFGQTNEGEGMEDLLKMLSEALGVDLSEEDGRTQKVADAIKSLSEKATLPPPAPQPTVEDKLKKLSETDPAVAQLLAEREVTTARLAALEKANRLSEVSIKLTDANTDKAALPPAFVDTIKPLVAEMPLQLGDKVIDAVKELVKTGLVPLGEIGNTGATTDHGDAVKQFSDAITTLQTERKLSYTEAYQAVGKEQPELWAAYNDAQLKKVDA